jgi:hypothetical protein
VTFGCPPYGRVRAIDIRGSARRSTQSGKYCYRVFTETASGARTETGLADRGIGFRSLQEAIDATTLAASSSSTSSPPWPSSNAI